MERFTGWGRYVAIGGLAALTVLGERRSLGSLIERTPVLREARRAREGAGDRGHQVRVRDGRCRLGAGEGHRRGVARPLAEARGLRVQAQKFDPYLNVDPGTMSPFQHGEVFVTEDGAETDLDIGHYERFIDENLSRNASHHRGRDLGTVLRKERRGEFPVPPSR